MIGDDSTYKGDAREPECREEGKEAKVPQPVCGEGNEDAAEDDLWEWREV